MRYLVWRYLVNRRACGHDEQAQQICRAVLGNYPNKMSSDSDSSGEMVDPLPAPASNSKSARQTPPPTELQAKLIALSKQQKASDPPHLRRPSDDKIDASRLQSMIQTPTGRTQNWYESTFSSELGLVEASELKRGLVEARELKRRESGLSFHSMTNDDNNSEAAGSESGAADNDNESGSFTVDGDNPTLWSRRAVAL